MAKDSVISALDQDVKHQELFFEELGRLMGASIGVIAVRTREINRAKELLHQWSSLMGLDFRVWTCLTGYQIYQSLPVTDESENGDASIQASDDMSVYLKPKETDAATMPLDNALQFLADRGQDPALRDKVCAVFMGFTEEVLKNDGIQQHIRDHTQRAYQTDDRLIILLEPGAVIPSTLKTDIEVVDLMPPSYAELLDTLQDYADNIKDELGVTFKPEEQQFIVQNALGMTQQEFENAISLAVVDMSGEQAKAKKANKKRPILPVDFVNVIKGRKLEILKNTEVLELMKDARMEDIGGLETLKGHLARTAKTFTPDARAFGIKPPKGILLVGVPGTAKSLIGRATGTALGIPTIKLALDRLFGSLVGQTEQRARMAFKMIEEMAPCVVFIDEIDKVFKQDSGGDAGVSSRLLGMFLTWLQDKHDRGLPIYITASANDVSNFPPELVRKGRFDKIFALTFPNDEERAAIFKIHVELRGHKLLAKDYEALSIATKGYVGSEIEAGVEEALVNDFFEEHDALQVSTLHAVMQAMIPQSKSFAARIKKMSDWCDANATPASIDGTFIVADDGNVAKPAQKIGLVRPKPRKLTRASKGD